MMPGLRPRHIAVGRLQQFQDDILDVLADIAGFGQGGGIHDGERNVQHPRQRLRQQRLAGTRGPDQQNVGLGQLHLAVALAVHVDALVMVVNRYRQLLLGLVLANHVLVQKGFHLVGLGQMIGCHRRMAVGPVILQNGIAHGNALVANVGPRIIAWRRNQLGHGVLGFMAKRTTKDLLRP